jgi:hypothetical protein
MPQQDDDELLFSDEFWMHSLDEVLTVDNDCEQPRRRSNPFDDEPIDGRDDNVSLIGSFDDYDALGLSLLGTLDMN